MKLVELTEFLLSQIIDDKESFSVKQFEDDEFINIEVLISSDDMGAVIGKGGKMANAIRTIVQASAYANGQKKVKVNFDAF